MRRDWRRWLIIPVALAGLVLTTAGGCDPGYITKREWREDARGFKICDLTVQPNSTKDAAFKLKGLSEKTCNKCPVGAKWPDCGKAKDPKPKATITKTWKPGG
jgi:hypothetical protein